MTNMTKRSPFQRIGAREAEALAARADVLLVDVRDSQSFAARHIDGARNVSMASISALISEASKTLPVVIYCYHGNASREYAQVFSDFGFTEVYSVDGGFEAWNALRSTEIAVPNLNLRQWLTAEQFPPGSINAAIANGMTPLMKACQKGDAAIVRCLISNGADLNKRNADGNNALWLACVSNDLDIIDSLIEAGIDIDNRNDNGATALMYAASSGKAAVVAHLVAKGADTRPETLDGFSALDLASTAECLALLRPARRRSSSEEGFGPA